MAEFEYRMAALRARFVTRATQEAARIALLLDQGDRDGLRAICHELAGTAGVFGFGTAGEAASMVEDAIDAGWPGDQLGQATMRLLEELAALPQGR